MHFSAAALLGFLCWLSSLTFSSSTDLQRNGGEVQLIQRRHPFTFTRSWSLQGTSSSASSTQGFNSTGTVRSGSTLSVTTVALSSSSCSDVEMQPSPPTSSSVVSVHSPPKFPTGPINSTWTLPSAGSSNAAVTSRSMPSNKPFPPSGRFSISAFSSNRTLTATRLGTTRSTFIIPTGTRQPARPSGTAIISVSNSSLIYGSVSGLATAPKASSSAVADTALNPFHITPTYPLVCSSASVTYSSTRAVRTGQLLIEPDQHVEWSMSPNWTFRASDGGVIKRMFSNDGPDTSFSGHVVHNGNPTANPDGSWTLTPKEGSVTRAIFAVFEGQSIWPNGTFPFTVTGLVKCDKPVPKACTIQDHQLSQDQWMAFSTDTFLNQSIANWTRQSNNQSDFWPWFVKTYVGDGFATSCTVDSDGGCGPLTQVCTDMIKGPWYRQAYLVMASMMQVSRFLHFAYAAFGQAETDLLTYIPTWDAKFSVPNKESNWKTILAVFASVTGMLSVVAFFVAPFLAGAEAFTASITGAVIFGISAAFNGAINFANAGGQEVAEPMFLTYASSLNSMKSFIEINQWDLISLHNAYFLNATNLTSLLLGGVFVGGQLITQVVDTKNIPATADASLSGKIKGAANWYDKFTILNLLNAAWTSAGIYIVYIEYGDDVKYFGKKPRKFSQDDCMGKLFYNSKRYNGTVAFCCDCAQDRPGMLAFMNSGFDYGEYSSMKDRDFFDVQGYQIIDYAFDYRDVLTSAFKSFDQHGYKFNITHETTREALATGNYDLLKSWTSLKPTDAGVFNIPVCNVYDLAEVPGCYSVGDSGGSEWTDCWAQPGSCLRDTANYTAPSGKVSFFRDNVIEDVITSLDHNQPISDFLLGAP